MMAVDVRSKDNVVELPEMSGRNTERSQRLANVLNRAPMQTYFCQSSVLPIVREPQCYSRLSEEKGFSSMDSFPIHNRNAR